MRVIQKYFIFPLLASFSLTSIGVIFAYYLNKKKDNEDVKNKRFIQNSKEIKIPRHFVPLIIGKSGSVIQDIQTSTNTIITFKEEIDIGLLERTCFIVGNNEDIELAEEKIKSILNNQPLIETYETWVPSCTINLTEKGRETINEIENSSNAKIILFNNVDNFDLDSKKRVIINGTAEQIANAIVLIDDKVKEDRQKQIKTETSSLTRVPRVKTSPVKAALVNNEEGGLYSKEIFDLQENEGLMEVYVTAVQNPSQFYIQVAGSGNTALNDLINEMTIYYDTEENRDLHTLKQITVGQSVAAKYSFDLKWYRAEIIADLGDDKYDVQFLDFGDREDVSQDNIFELLTDFLSLRLQAIECCLADVKPVDGKWSSKASMVFSKLSGILSWDLRVAKIKGYKERTLKLNPNRRECSPIPCIELYEKRDDQLINIGKELIKLELASQENDVWSAASSTPSASRRTWSPEEMIDLTHSPKSKSVDNIEVIDLTTPSKEWKNGSASPIFDENERDTEITWNINNNKQNHKNAVRNPFKPRHKIDRCNVFPAGYESELSDCSDDFEIYSS